MELAKGVDKLKNDYGSIIFHQPFIQKILQGLSYQHELDKNKMPKM